MVLTFWARQRSRLIDQEQAMKQQEASGMTKAQASGDGAAEPEEAVER